VTVTATSTSVRGDSISLPIGREQVANQLRAYLAALQQLTLPEAAGLQLPVQNYDVSAASAVVASDANSTDVKDMDALSRLMLAEKAIYHFYGTGGEGRAFDNELATPGVANPIHTKSLLIPISHSLRYCPGQFQPRAK
jgi:hypothetical protein